MPEEKQKFKKEQKPSSSQYELDAIWQELLGTSPVPDSTLATDGKDGMPKLDIDPWSTLLQAKGVEVVDLQAIHLQMSDQEVEQVLQVMQEGPLQDQPDNLRAKLDTK